MCCAGVVGVGVTGAFVVVGDEVECVRLCPERSGDLAFEVMPGCRGSGDGDWLWLAVSRVPDVERSFVRRVGIWWCCSCGVGCGVWCGGGDALWWAAVECDWWLRVVGRFVDGFGDLWLSGVPCVGNCVDGCLG